MSHFAGGTSSGWRRAAKALLPPLIIDAIRGLRASDVSFSGRYENWNDARAHCDGYEQQDILDKALKAAQKVLRGEAAFERDSVTFEHYDFPYPALAGLLLSAAANEGKLNLVDFGGGLGSLYFQLKPFLRDLQSVEWSVIEQPHFVACGQHHLADNRLSFYSSIEACIASGKKPNAILLSSVLPYLESPYELLGFIRNAGFQFVIVDRTPLIEGEEDILTVQHVRPPIYDASYPSWLFAGEKFRRVISEYFEVVAEFVGADGVIHSGGHHAEYRGFVLRQKGSAV